MGGNGAGYLPIWQGGELHRGSEKLNWGEGDTPPEDALAFDSKSRRFMLSVGRGWTKVGTREAEAFLRNKLPLGGERRKAEGCVVFVSDDGLMADHVKLGPLAREGVPFTLALTRDFLEGRTVKDHMTCREVNEMVSWGCEVAGHSLTHRVLNRLRSGEIRKEIGGVTSYLRAQGWEVSSFVYPYGEANLECRRFVWNLALDGCEAHGGPVGDSLDPTLIPRMALGSFEHFRRGDAKYCKNLLERAFRTGGMLVFMLHPGEPGHGEEQQRKLVNVIAHARKIGLRIVTLRDAVRSRGPLWQEEPQRFRQWVLARDGRFRRIWTGGGMGRAVSAYLKWDSFLHTAIWKARKLLFLARKSRKQPKVLSDGVAGEIARGGSLVPAEMPASVRTVAGFVQGFFLYLESEKIAAAILHGWKEGFDRILSDVDFVVSEADFRNLIGLVHQYCEKVGWSLCQVFRHEPTSAYCICSCDEDKGMVVALDGCSHYLNRGRLLLRAKDLLAARIQLPWGGFGLEDETAIRYSMLKSAIKAKEPGLERIRFEKFSEGVRSGCAEWLKTTFGVSVNEWSEADLAGAFGKIDRSVNLRIPWIGLRGSETYLERLRNPTGMVVVTGSAASAELIDELALRFQPYFRWVIAGKGLRPWHCHDLVRSTLLLIPKASRLLKSLTPPDCLLELDCTWDLEICSEHITAILKKRLMRRESLT